MRFSLTAATAMASLGMANAFSATANDNVVLYWGQNSAGSQETLGTYCESSDADIYVISFLTTFPSTQLNIVGCDDTFSGTDILTCSSIGDDIKTCQGLGKKVLLSLGGAVGTYGFSDDSAAEDYAGTLWNMFAGGSSDTRPFGDAVIDGFDLDIENNNEVGYAALTNKLRDYFSGGEYYISGAPQCVYPDASLGDALTNGYFDFVFVQFYNNPCGIDKTGFNWDTWKNWAASSTNTNVKIFLGIPASSTAASSGYSTPSVVESIVSGIQGDSCFGGIMMWDASQAFSNMVDGSSYCANMKSVLGGSSSSGTSSAAVVSSSTAAATSAVVVASSASTIQTVQASSAQEIVSTSSAQAIASTSSVVAPTSSSAQAIASTSSAAWVAPASSSVWVAPTSSSVVVISAPVSSTSQSIAQTSPTSQATVQTATVQTTVTPSSAAVVVVTVFNKLNDGTAVDIAADVEDSTSVAASSTAVVASAPGSSVEAATTTITSYSSIISLIGSTTVVSTISVSSTSSPVYAATTAVTQYLTVTAGSVNSSSSTASSVAAESTSATVGSGTGSVIDASDVTGVCAGKSGTALSSCLNKLFAANEKLSLISNTSSVQSSASATVSAASSSSSDTCTDGAVSCYDGKFALCNFSEWVYFDCPASTVCSASTVDGESVVVGCNFESVVLAEESSASAAEASSTAALKMFKRTQQADHVYIRGNGAGMHRHHVHRAVKAL